MIGRFRRFVNRPSQNELQHQFDSRAFAAAASSGRILVGKAKLQRYASPEKRPGSNPGGEPGARNERVEPIRTRTLRFRKNGRRGPRYRRAPARGDAPEEFSCRKSWLFPRPRTRPGSPFWKKGNFAKSILSAKKNLRSWEASTKDGLHACGQACIRPLWISHSPTTPSGMSPT